MGTAGRVGDGGDPKAELERREGRGWDASHAREPGHVGQGIILEGCGGQEDAAHPFIRRVLRAYFVPGAVIRDMNVQLSSFKLFFPQTLNFLFCIAG